MIEDIAVRLTVFRILKKRIAEDLRELEIKCYNEKCGKSMKDDECFLKCRIGKLIMEVEECLK